MNTMLMTKINSSSKAKDITSDEYIDLLTREKQRFESMVRDMDEVERLTEYQKLLDRLVEADEVIKLLKKQFDI